jgi:hypothetical protein
VPLHHFLLIFDLDLQSLVGEVRQFSDPAEAANAYAALEGAHRDDRNLEIVLIGADSLDTIRRTHPNYFGEPSTSPYLTAVR